MTADDLIPFVRENGLFCSSWTDKTLWKHLNWFLHHDLCQVVIENNEITAIGLARPVKDNFEHYVLEKEGDAIFVDFVCTKTDLGKKWLYESILSKIGRKDYIIFNRTKGNNLVKKYNLTKLMNKFSKENK